MNAGLWSTLALLLLNLIGFIIMLAGIIALQATCRGSNQPKEFGDGGLLDPSLDCSDFHQYQWFKVLWQGFLLLLNTVILVTELVPVFTNALAILRAVSTVLLMDAANDYLSVLRSSKGQTRRDSSVFFAGVIISIVSNLLLIIVLTSKWHLLSHRRSQKGGADQSTQSEQRRPDVEAPVVVQDGSQTERRPHGKTRQPARARRQQLQHQAGPNDPPALTATQQQDGPMQTPPHT